MNYYAARPREDNGLFHYTCRNDDETWPVGYCSAIRVCGNCNYGCSEGCQTCDGKGFYKVANACPGHETAEEAYDHMREYLIDTGITLNAGALHEMLVHCSAEGCSTWASEFARVKGLGLPHDITLCPAHMNEETVASFIQVGEVCSS